VVHRLPADSRLRFADHVERSGVELFERVCKLDLESIVAKYKFGPYGGEDALSTWYKTRNRNYSQMVGRNDLFERDRHKEPVPGWHTCELRA
jgi:ATP-dependent DNA ligase